MPSALALHAAVVRCVLVGAGCYSTIACCGLFGRYVPPCALAFCCMLMLPAAVYAAVCFSLLLHAAGGCYLLLRAPVGC